MSKKSKQLLPKNYFGFFINILSHHGIQLTDTPNHILKQIFSFVSVVNIPYFYTCQGYYEMALVSDDFQMLINLGSVLIGQTSALAQYTIMKFYHKDIGILLKKLQEGYFKFDPKRGGDVEFNLIKRAIRISNIQATLYVVGVVLIVLLGLIEWIHAYVTGVRRMPYVPMSFINVNHTPIFEIACGYQIYCELSYGIIVATMDTLTSSILVHIFIQLCVLKESIVQMRLRLAEKHNSKPNNILTDNTIFVDKRALNILFRNELRHIIKHHANIIEFTQQFESIFHFVIFFKFIGCILSLCFLLYQMSLLPVGSIGFNFIGIFYIIIVLQLLLYCWWANESVITSQEIAIEISKLDWIDKDEKIQKALMMVVRQSQKPLKFTAGKIFMLDINTFVSIVYSGFSYFTILKRVDEKKDAIE